MLKTIYTSKGEEILVSDEDYPLLSRHTWDLSSNGYARTSVKSQHVYMHQIVQPAEKGKVTDHINRNKLDNRRENLRVVSYAENNLNAHRETNDTGFIGVYKAKTGNHFYGVMSHKNKQVHIKKGKDEKETAMFRDYVAWRVRGKHVILNFPEIDYANFQHPMKGYLDNVVEKILQRW